MWPQGAGPLVGPRTLQPNVGAVTMEEGEISGAEGMGKPKAPVTSRSSPRTGAPAPSDREGRRGVAAMCLEAACGR